jgi:ribosome biogenesis GTPase
MSQRKPNKQRADFRKNRAARPRKSNWTSHLQQEDAPELEGPREERISGKGELTRRRTIVAHGEVDSSGGFSLNVDRENCIAGRVLAVYGLQSEVETEDGRVFQCATRRLLKTLSTDLRHVVVAGDRVLIRTAGEREGIIERIEPRHGIISRTSRGRQHVIVANVDQLVIVASAAEPQIKPNLIDRYIVSAEKGAVRPILCVNKVDLVDLAELQPLVGVYSQLGYQVLLTSAATGMGLSRLRELLAGRESVVSGQSGVGKSSLLNAVDPGFQLRVGEVSSENQKGRHTTTSARLLRMGGGGYVVDTPGIRQFELWDVEPQEVAGYFRDLRPFVSQCRFPDCTHMQEAYCAVKDAVADDLIDERRYESYCQMVAGD